MEQLKAAKSPIFTKMASLETIALNPLFGQNQLTHLGALQGVEHAVMANSDGFVALQ